MGTRFSCYDAPLTDDPSGTRTIGSASSNIGDIPEANPMMMKDPLNLVDAQATPDDLDVPILDLPMTGFSIADESWIPYTFTLSQLKSATRNFRDDRIHGEGRNWIVYKGFFYNPREKKIVEVAIKKSLPDCSYEVKEWQADIPTLGSLRHQHLVQLIGYCDEDGEGYLIYEFMPGGSLDKYLFTPSLPASLPDFEGKTNPSLSWDIRLRVALQVAIGLDYLHEKRIMHLELKSPNILIDKEFNAKITDFGYRAEDTRVENTDRIVASMGYVDPMYLQLGLMTFKNDVYAFGVLLMELLTGRRAHEENELPLLQWTREHLQIRIPKVKSFMDPDLLPLLSDPIILKGAQKLAIAARRCLDPEQTDRPTMGEMVEFLRTLVVYRL